MFNSSVLHNFLNTGVSDSKDYETNRRIFMVNMFGLVGIFITLVMGTEQLVQGNWKQTLILYFAAFIYFLGHYYQKRTGNFQVASNIILLSLYALMIYLTYTGGVANTGPLWIFMVAPVSLFFGGLVKGLRDTLTFVAIITVMLFAPENMFLATSYTVEFKSRLLLSFLTVTFLSAFYEYSRQQSFQFMQHLSEKYEQLARLDPLTRLSNRRDAIDKIEYELRGVERNNTTIALILCDIDFFKKVNDIYGHEVGDIVLKRLANAFCEALRNQDTVARWGGEEFLIILPRTNATQAQVVAQKLRNRVHALTVSHQEHELQITVSMGLAELSNSSNNITNAVADADKHLYQAKAAGRDCIYPLPAETQPGTPQSNTSA
jgi:diguanylate cyclase (GGDEF)-like protein